VTDLDPVALQIRWARLINVADQMAATLVKTAFSLVVRDNHDYACGLYDSTGRMLVQSNQCTPGQIGSMPTIVRAMLEDYPADDLAPGDVLIGNDPWIGAGHAPDVFLAQPVFRGARLVGFACNCAHHIDFGGRLAAVDARDVREEGLILPVCKLLRGGEANRDVFRLIRRNVREADKVIGDLRAQIASLHVGAQGVLAMMDAFGLEEIDHLTDAILARSEGALRAAIATLPDGVAEHEVRHEATGPDGERLRLALRLEIRGSDAHLDFAGTAPQIERPINAVLNITRAYVVFPFLAALTPETPMNDGCFRPLHVTAPEGSVLNSSFPAPGMYRSLLSYYTVELVFGALAQFAPERIMAPSGTYPLWIEKFAGPGLDGRPFVSHYNAQGGQGAFHDRDGNAAVVFPGNVANSSIELFEAETPLVVERKRFRSDSGGPGRRRGGLGQETVIRSRAPGPITAALSGGRLDEGPSGLDGGGRGARAEIRTADAAGREGDPFPRPARATLAPGERAVLRQPGGGGFGDPFAREPERVLADVREGFVTPEGARRDYGVAVVAGGAALDLGETERLRRDRRAPAGRTGRPNS
jgi:N-methylhydantoinase B/oxoprolinase/acetone carboxylase alpha subunit